MSEKKWLTYRGAAHRVGRSVRTINRWRGSGMPMSVDQEGRRIVEEEVLLAEYRKRLDAWPPHQHRVRAAGTNLQAEGWS